ncbi:MAG: glycosyl transferase family 1 [Armatimonadota bacterium]|nr:MAG: glycosyl transferase family 1 [Armatimonadota bacterium]
MKVGYFGRPIGAIGGIARHTTELLAALGRVAPANQYLVYTNRPNVVFPLPGAIIRRGPARIGRVLWEQVVVASQLRRDRPDVYHSPDFTLPLTADPPMIVTVHDLIYLKQPQGTSWRAAALYRLLTGPSVRKARRVLAVSQHSAREVRSAFGLREEQVTVVPSGVSETLRRLAAQLPPGESRETSEAPRPYILYAGLLTSRKGVLTLLGAFEHLRESGWAGYLVLAGLQGSDYATVAKRIASSAYRESILLKGAVDDATLARLYASASVFCLPSFHEGFGLTVLEAMTFGCPVVASECSAIPEAVGDCGLLAPPGDPSALAEALRKVLLDEDLAASLRERGRQRAGEFTWDGSARRTLEVYREVGEDSR